MSIPSIKHCIYKGVKGNFGAMQFSLGHPHYTNGTKRDYTGACLTPNEKGFPVPAAGYELREGAVFLEMTKAAGPNQYDWTQSIRFALSVQDIGKLLLGLGKAGDTELMHDPGAGSDTAGQTKKYLNVKLSEKGALFSLTQVKGEEKITHTVPASPDEVVVLRQLLTSAITACMAW